jgi:predicted phage terminase large subunit-like protein
MISDAQVLGPLLRTEFSLFLQFAFREIGGEGAYAHSWHIDAIIHQLDRIRKGHNRRLIVTMPPRHLKSVTISTVWVAWMLGKNPALRFICVSYGQDLADKHARDCLRIMQSSWYRATFPSVALARRTISDFETSAGGGRLSTSLGGVLTGRGANIIVIDDPMKADEAMQEHSRQAAKEWLHNSLMSRLDSQEHSSIILVMQRLHEADLAGELIERGGWDELRLSAIATHDERVQITGDHFYQRRTGCALHPARQSLAVLNEIRSRNSLVFAAQYQQEPVPREGAYVIASWFPNYDEPPTGGMVIQSWDTAVKTGVRNDWSVGITARYYQQRFYILDVIRRRMTFGDLRDALARSCRRFGVERLLIEDASSGQQLIQQLRSAPLTGVPLPIAVRPESDKVSRFEAQASRIQAGEVVLPQAAPWLAEFLGEVTGFPNARHDDQADALAQLLANAPRDEGLQPLGGSFVLTGDDYY